MKYYLIKFKYSLTESAAGWFAGTKQLLVRADSFELAVEKIKQKYNHVEIIENKTIE